MKGKARLVMRKCRARLLVPCVVSFEKREDKEGKLAMKWSWRIGRIAGIDVEMHATFLILLVWVGVHHYLPKHSWTDVWDGIIFTIALFGIVVLHELGHALTARRFGRRAVRPRRSGSARGRSWCAASRRPG